MTPDEIELLKANARAENSPWAWMKLGRLLGKREPTTYQRSLLAHIVNAQPRSALK